MDFLSRRGRVVAFLALFFGLFLGMIVQSNASEVPVEVEVAVVHSADYGVNSAQVTVLEFSAFAVEVDAEEVAQKRDLAMDQTDSNE